jgi:alkanesulfonate monooxygenase SsuD/methylene tetrahydromethanopterin reductase-like flavin-dependent oxidoreductase (luciferase family)
MRFGILLPHFGSHARASRIVDGAVLAEGLGYDSVWVRDHIVYWPHEFEDPDPTWMDPFVVLSAVAARTERLQLGTATLIPYRHPILAAQLLASLASFAGPDRLLMAWGRGNDDREFAAVQLEVRRRGALLEEQLDVIRRLWTGQEIDHEGEFYAFEGVRLRGPGLEGPVAHWYGGGSPQAIERTVRKFDGLLASRTPRAILGRRIDYLRQLSEESGRTTPPVGLITLVSPTDVSHPTRLDLPRIMRETTTRFPELDVRSAADLDGLVVTGSPSEMADEVAAFHRIGVDHFIFDLRAHFDEWESCMELIAREVLPLASA